MLRAAIGADLKDSVETFEGLLADFAKQAGGLRGRSSGR